MRARIWSSATGRIDYLSAKDHLVDLSRRYDVLEVAYDPALAELLMQQLEEEHGLAVTEVPQSRPRRSKIDAHAYELIVSGRVAHDGDPELADHVNAAVWRESSDQPLVLSKALSGEPIDALIAGAMASWVLEFSELTDDEPAKQGQILFASSS